MTISKRDKMLLLCLVGFGVFLALYLGVHNPFNAKRDEINFQINELQPRLAQLKEYDANKDRYESEIAAAKMTIAQLGSFLPREVREEDLIMLAIALEDEVGITVGTAMFTKPAVMLEFDTVVELENGGYKTQPVTAWGNGMAVSYASTYPQLKEAVRYVYSRSLLTTLKSVNIGYDSSTGELFGSMEIDKYFVTGIDDAYQPTQIPPVAQGTPNIFGSITN